MLAESARVEFLRWLEHELHASPLTVEAYAADLKGFLVFLMRHTGSEADLADLRDLRASDLRAWLSEQADAGLGGATRARHLAAVRGFFKWLARRHDVSNPQLRLLATPRARRPLPRALSAADARAIAQDGGSLCNSAATEARAAALFTILYGCGVRISEALALDVGDAPLPDGQAPLRVLGKGGKQRESSGPERGPGGSRGLADPPSRTTIARPAVRGRAGRSARPRRGAT